MPERYLIYHEYYDIKNKIIDLNFYTNVLYRYNELIKEATTKGGKSLVKLLSKVKQNDDMLNYYRGRRP